MIPAYDLFIQIKKSLWAHKVRSALALFGTLWGTCTVMMLLALSNGFYDEQIKNLAFLNNATIFAWAGTTARPFAGMPEGQKIHIQLNDFLKIMQNIPGVRYYSPVFNQTETLTYHDKAISSTVLGAAPGFDQIMQIQLMPGSRFIDAIDIAAKRRVLFIDDSVKKVLFGDKDALYQTVTLNQVPFTVVGVSNPNHASGIKFGENSIYVPYSTYLALNGNEDIHTIFLLPEKNVDVPRIKNDLIHLLAIKYHFDPNDDEAVHMPDLASQQLFVTWFFRAVELFLSICGALTLSVGGLGVANMMFLIVTERTREIGLCLALGASDNSILLQFFCETIVLIFFGGLLGFLMSVLLLTVLNHIGLPTWLGAPHISVLTVFVTTGLLIIIGTAAGYFPARRAANMRPVEALAF